MAIPEQVVEVDEKVLWVDGVGPRLDLGSSLHRQKLEGFRGRTRHNFYKPVVLVRQLFHSVKSFI